MANRKLYAKNQPPEPCGTGVENGSFDIASFYIEMY